MLFTSFVSGEDLFEVYGFSGLTKKLRAMILLIYEDFRSRSRHAKKITTGIWLIFRGLFFEHNAEIGRKDH